MSVRVAGAWVACAVVVAAIIAGGGFDPDPEEFTCDRTATTSTFASQLSAASGGQTLCLVAGTYSPSLITLVKGGMVTVRPDHEVAKASVILHDLQFDDAQNMTFHGVTVDGGELRGNSKNIDITHSTFTDRYTIKTVQMANADIDFEYNTHDDISIGPGYSGGDGRLYLPERNEAAQSDVRIAHSHFSGGNTDGILSGANGVVIEDNVFEDLTQNPSDPVDAHTDPIQLWGAINTTVRRNLFRNLNVASGIMIPDGGVTFTTFEDNVIDMRGSGDNRTFNLGGATNNVINHNTLIGGFLNRASNVGTPSSNNEFTNNVMTGGVSTIEGASFSVNTNNLTPGASSPNVSGSPTYVGGTTPADYEGYCLAPGSAGVGAASDDLDIGIRC